MKFNKYFPLWLEAQFKKSKHIVPFLSLPMFSIFVDNDLTDKDLHKILSNKRLIEKQFSDARNIIHKLGFPSMHCNVVISDLSKEVNANTGKTGDVAGLAYRQRKYMKVDAEHIKNPWYVKTIVHEWAHLWMFNNTKQFKLAVRQYYNSIKNYAIKKHRSINGIVLSRSQEDSIIDNYSMIIRSLVDNNNVELYMWSKVLDSIKNGSVSNEVFAGMVKYFPHSLTAYNMTPQKPSTINPEQVNMHIMKVGGGKFIVGVNSSVRREQTMNWNELIEYFDISEIKQNFILALDQYINHVKPSLDKERENAIRKFYTQIVPLCKSFGVPIHDNEQIEDKYKKIAHEWVTNIIWKRLEEIAQDDPLGFLTMDKKRLYDYMWVDNPLKPVGLSFVNTFKTDMPSPIPDNLSGAKFEALRNIVNDMVEWKKPYGMSNPDELWATAIENLLSLPMNHRQQIFRIMTTGEFDGK